MYNIIYMSVYINIDIHDIQTASKQVHVWTPDRREQKITELSQCIPLLCVICCYQLSIKVVSPQYPMPFANCRKLTPREITCWASNKQN